MPRGDHPPVSPVLLAVVVHELIFSCGSALAWMIRGESEGIVVKCSAL